MRKDITDRPGIERKILTITNVVGHIGASEIAWVANFIMESIRGAPRIDPGLKNPDSIMRAELTQERECPIGINLVIFADHLIAAVV